MKILFLDIDGTVLSHTTGSIPNSALEQIERIRQQGILVFGCTGRHKLELAQLPLEKLHVDGWITMNGSMNYLRDGSYISAYPISTRDLHVLYEGIQEMPFPCQFLEEDTMYMNMHDVYVEESLAKIHSQQDPIFPLDRILQNPIYMCIPWVKKSIFDPIQQRMHDSAFVRWNAYAIDCFSNVSGKNRGIEDVLAYYHLCDKDAVCIGDAENDLAMFEACKMCVAMGNACAVLKEHAKYVTDDIDHDGLAKAIKFLFK